MSPAQSSTIAGATDAITVTVQNTMDNVTYTATGYTGTMDITDTDGAATIVNAATGLPVGGTFQFTSAAAGRATFNVTFKTAGNQTITFADSAGYSRRRRLAPRSGPPASCSSRSRPGHPILRAR